MAWQTSKTGRLERLIVFLGNEARPVGELSFQGGGRIRTSLFRYARSWLEDNGRRPLYPIELPLRARAKDSTPYELPLPIYDASPDGWGRTVLEVAFPNRVFGMGELLAAAGDNRSGELRFGHDPIIGPEVWVPGHSEITMPDDTETIEDLAVAAEAVDSGKATGHHLSLLLRASADTGGARPKAHLRHEGGDWIAKFKSWGDGFDNPRMEAVCLSLAEECGIETPPHQFIEISGRSILLIQRFDRIDGGSRLGYMSAASLAKVPPSTYTTDWTYADVAAAARSAGIVPCEAELFRRMLFNCLIHNTDDHLRNHAFIRDDAGWRLSPVFDVVPNKNPTLVLRPSRGSDATADINAAFDAWPKFLIEKGQAQTIRDEIETGVQKLPELLDKYEVSSKDRETVSEQVPDMKRSTVSGMPGPR